MCMDICLYRVLTSEVQARLSIVSNSASAMDVQQICKSIFDALIGEDFSIGVDVENYQRVLSMQYQKWICQ